MAEPVTVGILGSGPATEAVEAALADVDAEPSSIGSGAIDTVDLAVVVGPAAAPVFGRVDDDVAEPWIAVELGGIGGRPVDETDAAISVLDPAGSCFSCLRTRVQSNAEGQAGSEPRTTRSDARLAGAIAGQLTVSVLANEVSPGHVVELPYVERRLLPVPDCDCGTGNGRHRSIDREEKSVPIDVAADRTEGAIDDRLGIVREIGEVHSFPAPYYLANLADTSVFSDAEAGPQAAGVAADWTPALVKAVGEALERYSAGVYRASAFERAPAAEVADAVPPEAFVLSPAFDEPDPAEPIRWCPGESLHTGESAMLPAEFAVFPPPEHRHAPSITTGLGLGTSGVGALLSGLYEVLERDATMLAWYSTFEPLGLAVDDPGFDELARRARAEALEVTPLLVTQDVDVPVVSVAVSREGEWPRFAVGSDADLDPAAAARSALEEALQNWMELRAMGPERAAEDPSAIARYADLPSEAAAFLDTGVTVDAAGVGPAEVPSGREELQALLTRLDAVGLEAYAARLTPRDVSQLGFEAVRVLVPGAQPLFTGERFFGERARTVPRELGFQPRLDRAPHPYP